MRLAYRMNGIGARKGRARDAGRVFSLCGLLFLGLVLAQGARAGWWDQLTGQPAQPLPVDEAYRFSAIQAEPGLLVLRWEMPEDDYYLYRDKIKLLTGDKLAVISIEKGPAVEKEDAIYGRSLVYFNEAEVRVRIARGAAGIADPQIEVEYQGCWEGGICYPPQTKPVQLVGVPPAGSAGPDGAAAQLLPETARAGSQARVVSSPSAFDLDLTDQGRFASALSGGSVPWMLLLFFIAGLALSFTPCVLPMIPILSSVIVGHQGRASTAQALLYSTVYVLFMALTYTLAGIAAGLFGANIQAAFQEPWIIVLFSLMFVAFALAMFGFYELQVPMALQNTLARLSSNQRGGRIAGVATMGMLSALIVGPCVAAPLAGALVYIGQTGDPVLGGAALFSLSMGMGLPLILIGTSAGKLLPRAGHWMVQIKAGFGVVLLMMAIWMLDRIVPPVVTLVLLGALLVITSIYLHALDRLPEGAGGWGKLGKGVGVLMLLYGSSLLLGAAAGNQSLLKPLSGVSGAVAQGSAPAAPTAQFTTVTSLEQLEPVLASARQVGRPVMLDFYADWCVTCKELEAFVFTDPAVQGEFSRFTLVRVDVTANDAAAKALNQAYGLIGPPALILYDQQGQLLADRTLIGVPTVDDFLAWLRAV